MSEIELKPCPFCGSTDIAMWGGFGTQADIYCNDCCCERNVQVVDLCDNERPKFDEKTCRYPDWLVTRANEHLIEEWNTRAAQQDGVREATIEECAKVAEMQCYSTTGRQIASRIRDLATLEQSVLKSDMVSEVDRRR